METRPPIEVDLAWEGALRFRGRSGGIELMVDSDGKAGPSPVQTLAFALAGCMSVDVVHILTKGRHTVRTFAAQLSGVRAPEDPHRFTAIRLHFDLSGDMEPDKVERAIALSREKYCSVWHSLRQDIDFRTSFDLRPNQPGGASGQ